MVPLPAALRSLTYRSENEIRSILNTQQNPKAQIALKMALDLHGRAVVWATPPGARIYAKKPANRLKDALAEAGFSQGYMGEDDFYFSWNGPRPPWVERVPLSEVALYIYSGSTPASACLSAMCFCVQQIAHLIPRGTETEPTWAWLAVANDLTEATQRWADEIRLEGRLFSEPHYTAYEVVEHAVRAVALSSRGLDSGYENAQSALVWTARARAHLAFLAWGVDAAGVLPGNWSFRVSMEEWRLGDLLVNHLHARGVR